MEISHDGHDMGINEKELDTGKIIEEVRVIEITEDHMYLMHSTDGIFKDIIEDIDYRTEGVTKEITKEIT